MNPLASLALVFILLVLSLRYGRRYSSWALAAYPMVLIIYFYFSVCIFSFGRNVPFDLFRNQDLDRYFITLSYIGIFPLVGIFGKFLAAKIVQPPKMPLASTRNASGQVASSAIRHKASIDLLIFFLSIAPAILVVAGSDLGELLERRSLKLDLEDPRWLVYADSIFWVSILAMPFVSRPALRFVALAVVALAYAAAGERQAAVAFVLFVIVDRFVLQRKSNLLHISLLAIGTWLLTVLMAMRTSWTGGLEIILSYSFLSAALDVERLAFALNYMTNYSVVVSEIGLSVSDVDSWAFFYAVNPLPSFILDRSEDFTWYSRLQPHVPFPGFAFAINFLGPFAFFLWVFAIFLAFDLVRNLFVLRRQYWEAITYVGWATVPFVFSLQYNLRACTRLLFMLWVVYFVVVAASRRHKAGRGIWLRGEVFRARGGWR